MNYSKILKTAGLGLLVTLGLMSCKKYAGDSYDFSSTAQKYIQFKSGQSLELNTETVDTVAISGTDTIEGYYYLPDAASLVVESREGLPNDVTCVIGLQTDAASRDITATYPSFTVSKKVTIMTEDADFGADDMVTGTLTFKSASGYDLRLGFPKAGSNTVVNFTANKPYVFHAY